MAGASSWQEGGPSRGTDGGPSLDGEALSSGRDTKQAILQILLKAERELIDHAEADVLLRHREAEPVKRAVEVRTKATFVRRETCLFFFSKPTVVAKKARTGTAWLNLTYSSPRGGSLKSLKASGPDFESSGHQHEGILKRSGSLYPKDKLRLSKMGMNIKPAKMEKLKHQQMSWILPTYFTMMVLLRSYLALHNVSGTLSNLMVVFKAFKVVSQKWKLRALAQQNSLKLKVKRSQMLF
ncbi:hypothetical protein AB1Y20_005907 [Prymnesium parvum]|uniref:Uncharacterized protein n=1 Tax=Prymnesium parvum TaxID=97485 RepID=A0AB34J151_PRYPA